jgi:hypothetical protein
MYAVSEALCLVFDEHYTESINCLVSGEEKGRHALSTCVSHLRKREMRITDTCLISEENGDTRYGGASPFYLTAQKRVSTEYSPSDPPCASTCMIICAHAPHLPKRPCACRCRKHHVEHKQFEILDPLRLLWV